VTTRNDTIAALDVAVVAVGAYIEQVTDSAERARLVGVLPDLRDARYRFERATAPEEEA
jgi:hypothetical protein